MATIATGGIPWLLTVGGELSKPWMPTGSTGSGAAREMGLNIPESIKHQLRSSARHDFEGVVHGYLAPFIPGLSRVATLRDRDGVDLVSLDDEFEIDVAIQCKGLESQFSDETKAACLDSIRKFRKSGRKAGSFRILVNRPIREADHRVEIEAALDALVADGIVKSAQLMPFEKACRWLGELAIQWLKSALEARWHCLRDDYAGRMGGKFHIDSVPCRWDDGSPTSDGPLSELLRSAENYVSRIGGRDVPKRILLVGEFGFGKTTLLLRLFEHLDRTKFIPIYAPVTQFNDGAFSNEKMFVAAILAPLLEDVDWSADRNLSQLLRDALTHILRSDVPSALLLDGLDEHPFLYRSDGIGTLMNCMGNFDSQVVLSMRKEFWDERAGDFRAALDSARGHNVQRKTLYLEDWEQPQMEVFVSHCEGPGGYVGAGFAQFARNIRSGRYMEHYGDIPRRPLFLNMLAEEAAVNADNLQNLAILYYRYLRRKIARDHDMLAPNPCAGRPLVLAGCDLEKRVGAILDALTEIAGITALGSTAGAFGSGPIGSGPFGGGETKRLGDFGHSHWGRPDFISLQADFTEADINRVTDLDGSQLAANSLLTPSGARSIQGIRYRFAHRSFQEWFVARWMRNHSIPDAVSMPPGLMTFRAHMAQAGAEIP